MATTAVVLPKPATPTTAGWRTWLTTVDHKLIGIQYLVTSIIFFIVGGLEALLIRAQLGAPNNTLVSADLYNQLFTMHGTTMVFLAIMPLNTGLANYIVPLMIGAEDMAFPRLNAFGYWLFLFGGLFLYLSFFLGVAPNGGWFAYAPLNTCADRTLTECVSAGLGRGMDYWGLGLLILGISSLAGAINFIVTIVKMRAPGMTFNRMPLFVWATLVTSFLLLFALPAITVAIIMLMFDRIAGTHFFSSWGLNPQLYGDPLLWQHLFWFFGHPEVYIMILPPFGIISEILPTYSRKPIFGYAFIAYSSVAIGFLGFTVWAHHMFAVGMGPLANAAFATTTMLIGVPTGVKIFNWIATIWRGSVRFTTAMLFAILFIAMFIIGGISGVMLGSPPYDLQLTDTYFVVAHFHYVLFGGAMLGIFAAFYHWFPKMTGRIMSERLGKWHFWITAIGFNLTFLPMHLLGVLGMPRRIYTFDSEMGWNTWNLVQTIGSFLIALGVLIFAWNLLVSLRRGERADANPWDGGTLEWATASPPPPYNFLKHPVIKSRYPVWDMGSKVETTPDDPAEVERALAHLPAPTIYPLILAAGLTVMMIGIIYRGPWLAVTALGLIVSIAGMYGWIRQISILPEEEEEEEEELEEVTH
ncbi:MAG: cytochrome c oxidase subunit 1 [Herpetosiphonaceae bacterium]|nr:MAG: cytochrome c oxidase subunit 1 [Herpetosiphonaceae bacterium]